MLGTHESIWPQSVIINEMSQGSDGGKEWVELEDIDDGVWHPPNAGGSSNLIVKPGRRSGAEIEASLDRVNLVTDWLGGNANGLNH